MADRTEEQGATAPVLQRRTFCREESERKIPNLATTQLWEVLRDAIGGKIPEFDGQKTTEFDGRSTEMDGN